MKKISRADVVNTYRSYAPYYDRIFGATLEQGRKLMSETVHALQPESILEIGVGTGLTLGRYPSSAKIVGIDISSEMLEKARGRAAQLKNRNIHLECMDAESLAFPDESFDVIAIPYVLSVTPNPSRLIDEARRVCRRNGKIVIVNHFSGSKVWWALELLARPLADKIGFHSEFSYDEHILTQDWVIDSVKNANLFGLSKMVLATNTRST